VFFSRIIDAGRSIGNAVFSVREWNMAGSFLKSAAVVVAAVIIMFVLLVGTAIHCCPVKSGASAFNGMILNAVLAI